MEIRLAEAADLPAIVNIYNAAVPAYRSTADTLPVTVGGRELWFDAHTPERRPLWVAADADGLLGWVGFQNFYGRPAYNPTAEISVYVAPADQRHGVGRALLEHALAAAPSVGICTVLAIVFAHNEASQRLFASFGFAPWGRLPGVAHMPDGRRDILILGRELDTDAPVQRVVAKQP